MFLTNKQNSKLKRNCFRKIHEKNFTLFLEPTNSSLPFIITISTPLDLQGTQDYIFIYVRGLSFI